MTKLDGLLRWCQANTQGFKDVSVTNFHTSWKDGLAFCALIAKFRPDLLDFGALRAGDTARNLELAFSVGEQHLNIPRLLDFSVITYLGCVYQGLESPANARPAKAEAPAPSKRASRPVAGAAAGTQRTGERDKSGREICTGGTCTKCGKELEGEVVEVASGLFHARCFVCEGCGKSLQLRFVTVGGKAYCEPCAKKAFVKTMRARRASSNAQALAAAQQQQQQPARPAADDSRRRAEEAEAKRRAEQLEAAKQREAAAQQQREAEARRKAEQEAAARQKEAAQQREAAEARRRAEQEAARQREAAQHQQQQREAEAKRRAEQEAAARQREAESRRKAEQEAEARKKAEQEAARQREAEQQRARANSLKQQQQQQQSPQPQQSQQPQGKSPVKLQLPPSAPSLANNNAVPAWKQQLEERKRAAAAASPPAAATQGAHAAVPQHPTFVAHAPARPEKPHQPLAQPAKAPSPPSKFPTSPPAASTSPPCKVSPSSSSPPLKTPFGPSKASSPSPPATSPSPPASPPPAKPLPVPAHHWAGAGGGHGASRRAANSPSPPPPLPAKVGEMRSPPPPLEHRGANPFAEGARENPFAQDKRSPRAADDGENPFSLAHRNARATPPAGHHDDNPFVAVRRANNAPARPAQAPHTTAPAPVRPAQGPPLAHRRAAPAPPSSTEEVPPPLPQKPHQQQQQQLRQEQAMPMPHRPPPTPPMSPPEPEEEAELEKRFDALKEDGGDILEATDDDVKVSETMHRRGEPSLAGASMEGYLFKLEGWCWARRWFCLQGRRLHSYKDTRCKSTIAQSVPHPDCGSVDLAFAADVATPLQHMEHAIEIRMEDRTLVKLRASTEAEQTAWAARIREAMRLGKEQQHRIDKARRHTIQLYQKKEGYLQLLQGSSWKRVWVVMKSGSVFIYGNPGGAMMQTSALYQSELSEYDPEHFPGAFCAKNQAAGTTVVLRASAEEEMHMWLNALVAQRLFVEQTIDSVE
eukprot:m51a1_g12315 putative mical-like protein 2 (985) ;mRNA; f:407727-411285